MERRLRIQALMRRRGSVERVLSVVRLWVDTSPRVGTAPGDRGVHPGPRAKVDTPEGQMSGAKPRSPGSACRLPARRGLSCSDLVESGMRTRRANAASRAGPDKKTSPRAARVHRPKAVPDTAENTLASYGESTDAPHGSGPWPSTACLSTSPSLENREAASACPIADPPLTP